MTASILAIIAGLLSAIPIAWAWKLKRDKKKVQKDFEQYKDKIQQAVHNGNLPAVIAVLDDLL